LNLSRQFDSNYRISGPEATARQIDAFAAAIREVLPDLPAMLARVRESPRQSLRPS
jgi:hypothetical protein